jgi:hypothetical protein
MLVMAIRRLPASAAKMIFFDDPAAMAAQRRAA